VVVTRAAEQQGEARELLEAKGANVVDLPALVIVPPDNWGPLDETLTIFIGWCFPVPMVSWPLSNDCNDSSAAYAGCPRASKLQPLDGRQHGFSRSLEPLPISYLPALLLKV
jgi:hypothetical protein